MGFGGNYSNASASLPDLDEVNTYGTPKKDRKGYRILPKTMANCFLSCAGVRNTAKNPQPWVKNTQFLKFPAKQI